MHMQQVKKCVFNMERIRAPGASFISTVFKIFQMDSNA